MSRDERGRFLPDHEIRRNYPDEDAKRSVILSVRVTGTLAERAFSAAARRNTTLSELLRAYILRLVSEVPPR